MSPSSTERTVLTWAGVVMAGFLVLGALLLAGSLLHRHHGSASTPAATATASSSASALPSKALGGTSATPSPTASDTALPTADQMKDFVVQYLDTATTNQAAAWTSLTPRFRASSGGFASYQHYWGDITSAVPSDVAASPVDGLISYRVAYTHRSGAHTTDTVRLHLLYQGGQFLIDAEG